MTESPQSPPRHGAYWTLRRPLVKGLEYLVIAGFAALTLDVLWGVFSRYALAAQSRWTEELAIYLLIWVSLLGASLAYADHGHLGVDYLVNQLAEPARRIAKVLADALGVVFSAYVLLYGGIQLVSETLLSGQTSAALGAPMGYVYSAVPLSGVFFLLFSFEHLLARKA